MSSESMHEGVAISVRYVGKCYNIYGRPQDRLKQTLWRGRRQFYKEFWALRNVSFDVRQGESVALIGRNGSGKSTVLQIVASTLAPTEGEVRIRGRVAALLELGSGINTEFTGRENVFMQGAVYGYSPGEMAARFDEIAAFADIGEFINQPVKTYSSGMFVRLAFAVQALLDRDILLVDEALAVGDASFQRRCYRRIDELKERGGSVLFVTHSLEVVRSMCERAVYLEHGRVKVQGEASEVCDAYLADLLAEQVSESKPPSTVGAAEAGSAGETPEATVLDRFTAGGGAGKTVQGNRKVDLLWAELDHAGPQSGSLVEGDMVRVQARFRANETVSEVLFGVLIRDRYGVDVFGFSAKSDEIGLPSAVSAGTVLDFEATLKCDLRADTYFVTVGVQAEEFSDILYYGHDILKFTLEAPPGTTVPLIGGLARLRHSASAHVHPVQAQDR